MKISDIQKLLSELDDRKNFGKLLASAGLNGIGAEIGVAYGENARDILLNWEGTMFLIDPYKQWQAHEYIDGSRTMNMEGTLTYAHNHLSEFQKRLAWLRMTSQEAVFFLNTLRVSLDFAYIDGNHHQPIVSQDIAMYWNLVRPGGILGGHDYYDLDTHDYRCEVKSAVDRFVKAHDLQLQVTQSCQSWWILKPVK